MFLTAKEKQLPVQHYERKIREGVLPKMKIENYY